MATFYLIRHGENDRIAGDQSLNANGRRQAQITAAFLKDRRIDVVYASPLARARETAQAIADALGSTVLEDARLRERANFGDSPGQTLEEFISMWQACDRDRDFVPVVGLSARQNGQRLEAWMREVYHTRPQGIVVAGTHGGTITDFLLNYFSPAFLNGYRSNFLHNIRNCSITILHFDGAQFTLEALAVDEHLLPIAPM